MASITTGRPEPVLKAVGGAVAAGLAILVALHYVPGATADDITDKTQGVLDAVGALITVVSPLVGAFMARRKVTPKDAPVVEVTAEDGSTSTVPLVPVTALPSVPSAQPSDGALPEPTDVSGAADPVAEAPVVEAPAVEAPTVDVPDVVADELPAPADVSGASDPAPASADEPTPIGDAAAAAVLTP